MQVSDIMTKEVVTVSPSAKIIEVADLLRQKGFNGVPVVENGKVFGMITETDMISRGPASFHIPSLIKVFHEFKLEKYVKGKPIGDFRAIFEADAESIMNRDYTAVSPQTEITELIKIFQEEHANPVPVVDKESALVGIVSLSDIVKLISRFREAELNFISGSQ